MGEVFAVTSGKGGVGKSTVSVGIAAAFCSLGKKVLLVDMDEGLRCLDLMLGIDSLAVFDLSDILTGKEIHDAVYKSEYIRGLNLIPAPSDTGRIDVFSLTGFVNQVRQMYEIVIFDFPAGIDFTLYTALPKDTVFLTVAVPDPVSVRDASAVSARLNRLSFRSRLIINRFDLKAVKKGKRKNIDDVIDGSCQQLIGVVPESGELAMLSLNHRVAPRGRAIKAFTRIVKRLGNENVPMPKLKKI